MFELFRTHAKVISFGFVLMFFTSPGQTYFIALFSGEIRQDFNLSHGQFGAIYSLATLLSAFVLLKTGKLIDNVDPQRLSLYLVLLIGGAAVLFSKSSTIGALILAIFLLRQLGQGLLSMTASSTMMRFAPAAKGKANSLSNMGYSVAEAIVPTIVIALIIAFGWRISWLLIAAVMTLFVPLVIYQLAPTRVNQFDDQRTKSKQAFKTARTNQRQWTRAEVLRDPGFYLLTPALLSQSLLYTGFMFHQVHLVEEKGWPILVWGSLYAFFSITSIASMLLTGILSDRFGAVRLAPFVTLPMAVGLFSLSSSQSVVVAAVFMFSMGLSSGAQGALSAPFFAERYGSENYGAIKSMASFIMVLMTAISPVLLGWLIDAGFSMDVLAIAGAIFALCVVTMAAHYSWSHGTASADETGF